MKYRVQFQYRPKTSDRPMDHGQSFDLAAGARGGDIDEFMLLPNIGDHVDLPPEGDIPGDHGVVEGRLFTYMNLHDEMFCLINIVITDSDVDRGRLLKA